MNLRRFSTFPCVCMLLLVLAGCGDDQSAGDDGDQSADGATPAAGLDDVELFSFGSVEHVDGTVDYDESPPVGGDHNGVWQNCGYYDSVLANEHVVHSLEHGAVWVTYREATSDDDLKALQDLAGTDSHMMVSRYDDQDSPFVLTAWGRQLGIDSLDDPRLDEFIAAFIRGGVSPEPGASCANGVG